MQCGISPMPDVPPVNRVQIRYRGGTVDFLVLLDAERERLAVEGAQALVEIDLYQGIVSLYKALGGGCQPVQQSRCDSSASPVRRRAVMRREKL